MENSRAAFLQGGGLGFMVMKVSRNYDGGDIIGIRLQHLSCSKIKYGIREGGLAGRNTKKLLQDIIFKFILKSQLTI